LFTEKEGGLEVINEMWTASWGWEIQVRWLLGVKRKDTYHAVDQKRLPPGCTIAPLILSLDKPMISNFRGDNSAWPVYLTMSNIDKETRRQVSAHATIPRVLANHSHTD
jgi:hypothetical protein